MNINLYSLGLMSGTSIDGIDVSIIKSDGEQYLEIIDDLYLKYDDQLKLKLKKISKIHVVSIASMMAEAIKRISNSTSVSSLFK